MCGILRANGAGQAEHGMFFMALLRASSVDAARALLFPYVRDDLLQLLVRYVRSRRHVAEGPVMRWNVVPHRTADGFVAVVPWHVERVDERRAGRRPQCACAAADCAVGVESLLS